MARRAVPITRRAMLWGGGGLLLGLTLPRLRGEAGVRPDIGNPFNAFVGISADGIVHVLVKHIEFGQGVLTGLASLVAEELDARWSQVRASHAPADVTLYANLRTGLQGTGGSSSVSNSYLQMRQAGAAVRSMLVAEAAARWGVGAGELSVREGVVHHQSSGRHVSFGDLAVGASGRPVPEHVELKPPDEFRLIGRDSAAIRLDVASKCDGSAVFPSDLRIPGMLVVSVVRPNGFGVRLAEVGENEAMRVPGVVAVRRIGEHIAVYGTCTWSVLQGRAALNPKWDRSEAEATDTAALLSECHALVQQPGILVAAKGDVERVLEATSGAESTFEFPFLAHAPMEPPSGALTWNERGATAWFGSQMPTADQQAIARILELHPSEVDIQTQLSGGSFGRLATPDCEFAVELAQCAKAIGPDQPVKLIRTREDDIQGGYYRPVVVHRLRGALQNGKVSAWSATVAGHSFIAETAYAHLMRDGIDPTLTEGASTVPYDIPNFRCDAHIVSGKVPTLWWRSVGHSHTAFAVECFLDELLASNDIDPVDGRMRMLGSNPRAAAVLRAVADLSNWQGRRSTHERGFGVALAASFGSIVAQVASVSFPLGGTPQVDQVWCAVDCGLPVNPDIIRAQMEGSIIYGIGHALFGEITLADGAVEQSNFTDYRSLSLRETPEIEVVIIPSAESPTGVGEPGLPPAAPALANAIAASGRPRPYRLPLLRA